MDSREELLALRGEIDKIDSQLVGLFGRRMGLSSEVARVKAAGNISVIDEAREKQVVDAACALADEKDGHETAAFMNAVMALSKIRQNRELMLSDPVSFPASAQAKKGTVKVGFQGVSGAWGEHGAEQLFPEGELRAFDYFEDVFKAVRAGEVDCGVLPIENSKTGAIGEVYDLLRRHSCYIVGDIWISISQCLLAYGDASLADIREVHSHSEGFNQCRRFLKNRSWDLIDCRNTACAAQLVAEKKSVKLAAIGSRRAADVHGLTVLAPDIMDVSDNKTRFIAIAAEPVYDESCATTSITFSTAHRSGALCAVLEALMLAGINMTRLESRPVPLSAERYRFFADLGTNILSEKTLDALKQAATHCGYFEILGCYPTMTEK